MTFNQWIDDVNAQVRVRLSGSVRTEELSWDSAIWVSPAGTAVASLADDDVTAKIRFDGGEMLEVPFRDTASSPGIVGETIAEHLARR